MLQERQCVCVWSTAVVVENVRVTLVVDVWPSEELYRGADYTGNEEDEQDEGEQHHGAWEQFALRNVDDLDNDEDYGERANCYTVWHDPGGVLVVCFSNRAFAERWTRAAEVEPTMACPIPSGLVSA